MLYKDIVVNDLGSWDLNESIEQNHVLGTHVQSITFNHGEYYADHYADNCAGGCIEYWQLAT